MLGDGRSMRVMRDLLLVQQIEPDRRSGDVENLFVKGDAADGPRVELLRTPHALTGARVLAVGPEVHGVSAGDLVLVEGYLSGHQLGRGRLIVSAEIVAGVVELGSVFP